MGAILTPSLEQVKNAGRCGRRNAVVKRGGMEEASEVLAAR
jgi:hypothetical protein